MNHNKKLIKLSTINEILHQKGFSDIRERCAVFEFHLMDNANIELKPFLQGSHYSDFFSVIIVQKGRLTLNLAHKMYETAENHLIINTPSMFREPVLISEDCTVIGLNFAVDFLKELRLEDRFDEKMIYFSELFSPCWKLSDIESNVLQSILLRLREKLAQSTSHSYGRELLSLTFMEFIIEMAETGRKNSKINRSRYGRGESLANDFGKLARKYHISERNLDFYASRFFVSPKHLSETIKKVTGRTGMQILDDLLIVTAKHWLERAEIPIAEISYKLNFSTPTSFSKFFLRMEGMSPRDYRTKQGA